MINFTKLFNILAFAIIIGNGITIAMEQETTHTLMVCHSAKIARYLTASWHFSQPIPKNLPSTIKDPVIQCMLTDCKTKEISHAIIAAKYLFNPSATEPLLKLKMSQGNNKDHLNIMARCIKNEKLDGDNFLTQIKNTMTPLYNLSSNCIFLVYTEQPDDLLFSTDSKKDFITAGIAVTKEENNKITWIHGPNGCPNEQTLIKAQFTDVVQPKISYIYWFLKNYQCNQQELPQDVVQLIATALHLQPSTITIVK